MRLLGIGGAPYISHKIWLKNEIFIFSSSSLKPPADGASYYVCSNGGSTYIIGEIIAKDNLNIENFMQTFENLLLHTWIFKGLHQIFYVQIVFGYYFANNVGGATI